ncbi:hypothetical protein [Bdellovibrio sp. NC01]|uniref:hypothetical protein n=1 Tax=Bdellovibrio sp. NC01 TaxID=2220073 RepID=UPI001FEE80E2|nr:hypothetical protein [Bdellovibrio sp. NC01]
MRVLLTTIAALIVTGFLILTTRIWGLGQTFPEYKSPFYEGTSPMIIVKAETLPKIDEVLKLKPDAVIWVDVRMSREKTAFILSPTHDNEFLKQKEEQQKANPTAKIFIGGKLSEYPWEQINEHFKDTPALRELYEKYPNTRFVLNVVDNVSDVQTAVVSAIEDLKPDNRTLVQSEALVILSSIKELKPAWVYGTSTPDIMRFMSFDSLWILPATQFKGDVFVAPFKIMKRNAFNADIIEEMRRRHKPVFLGPIADSAQLKMAQDFKADGLITEDLPALLKMLEAKP